MRKNSSGFAQILMIVLLIIGLGSLGLYYISARQKTPALSLPTPSSTPTRSPSATLEPTQTPMPTRENGAELNQIKFTLPQSWEAKINEDKLFISPKTGGGFLSIKIYSFAESTDPKKYYCQTTRLCITGTTYFTAMNIGNIPGFKASALDNSGGGSEYFGSKGSNFYIISSFSPSSPTPNEFDKSYQIILDSLRF